MKKIVCLYMLLLAMILSTSCTLFLGGKGKNDSSKTEENNNDGLVNYNFKVSKFPYDSVGLTVKIYSKTGETENPVQVLGTITSAGKNDYIQKTVRLPAQIDLMYVYFETSYNSKKYYLRVIKDEVYDSANDLYDIDGYYNYYYDKQYYYLPYCGAGEANIREAELDKQYEYKWHEQPYLLFSVSGLKGKTILIKKESVKNADLYYSTDMEKILTYKASTLSSYNSSIEYECTTDVVYFMVRPTKYDYSSEDNIATYKIMFIDKEATLKRCLRVEKAYLASNNTIYASGSVGTYNYEKDLFAINIATNEVTQICSFADSIDYIGELQSGTLVVAHGTSISKVNPATGEITTPITDLPTNISSILPYKDNQFISFTRNSQSISGNVFLLNSNITSNQAISKVNGYYSYDGTKNIMYIPDYELYIYTNFLSPIDLCFLKFKEIEGTLKFYGFDSKYHGDYSYTLPNRVFNTSPLQIITTTGDIFDINTELITRYEPDVSNYKELVNNWCTHNDNIKGLSYDDCFINNGYIYYMKNDIWEDTCTVTKCSVQTPEVEISSIVYNNTEGKQFISSANKLWLITNEANSFMSNYYRLYVREINF